MFAAEFEGLKALAATKQIRTPIPYHVGSTEQESFLIMEHINFASHSKAKEAEKKVIENQYDIDN
jgi:protein-ribulosamine 3-kinase